MGRAEEGLCLIGDVLQCTVLNQQMVVLVFCIRSFQQVPCIHINTFRVNGWWVVLSGVEWLVGIINK